ncbi:MAG: hypothetical protein WBC74_04040 [Candidatus Omnitrophota bacterium]
MKRCKRCILPENFPHIRFDRKGVCSLCRAYRGRKVQKKLKSEYRGKFQTLLKKVAGKGQYDVLMCYSGGKDSTYTLSELKNKYKLKILAFTLDNGFIPGRTYVNMRNVVEKLGIDHMIFKPRFDILKKIFKTALKRSLYSPKASERASAVCTSCIGLVKYASLKIAVEKEIPLVGFGWSPGQAPVTSSVLKINPAMIKNMEKALKKPLRKIAGRAIEAYFLNERHYAKGKKFPIFVHPLAFLDYNEKRVLNRIKNLGWKMPAGVELNATNCLLNPLADLVHIRRHGFHPYVLEIANLVREGYMRREEGLKHIPFRKNKKVIQAAKKRLCI